MSVTAQGIEWFQTGWQVRVVSRRRFSGFTTYDRRGLGIPEEFLFDRQ